MKHSLSTNLGYPAIAAALGMLTALVSGILVQSGPGSTLGDGSEAAPMGGLVLPMLLGGLVCGIAGLVFSRALSARATAADAPPARLSLMKGAAFNGSSIPMLLVDRERRILDVNKSFLDLLSRQLPMFRQFWPDISPATIVGQCIDQFHRDPSHQAKLMADPARLPYRTDISVGDFKFALSVGAVIDDGGNFAGCTLEWVDVTAARVNAGIIDAIRAGQGVIELSMAGEILSVNDVLEKMLGYSALELRGKPISLLNPARKEGGGLAATRMWDELREGRGTCDKFMAVAKNGSRFWFNTMFGPICDQSGKPYKIVALMSDVTALEDMTFGQTAVIEFTPEGEILRANKPFLETMGYTEAEVVGKHHSMFMPPDAVGRSDYKQMWKDLTSGQAQFGLFKRVAKGGRTVYITGSYSPVRDKSGQVIRVTKIANDVTKSETERLEGIAHRERTEAQQTQVVSQLSAALAELAHGNLTTRLTEGFAPEYETLRGNFNAALEELETVLASAFGTSEAIRDQSIQITQAADNLAHRTETQAAALEEAAAALEQLTASVRAAAESAEKANTDAGATRSNAEQSGQIVREAVGAMSEIEKSSEHISQIIGVIEDIAFQTNLLALNAGVEAARAGDAGRGFAVVASEVRALAQRSSDAAKEISALISTSSQQVGRGVDLVRKSGKSLETIVASVAGITSLIEGIAHSAREQSTGLSEINTAITQLDQVTQENAAMVEESSAASHAMRADAEALEGIVKRFEVNVDLSPQGAAARPAAAASPGFAPPKSAAPRPALPAAARTPAPPRGNAGAALAATADGDPDDWTDF